jgi:hypothetical protein
MRAVAVGGGSFPCFCNCSAEVVVHLLFCYDSCWPLDIQEVCVPHRALNGRYFKRKAFSRIGQAGFLVRAITQKETRI